MSTAAPVFDSLQLHIDRGVVFVTIAHPPINLVDAALLRQLRHFARWLEGEASLRVVVFQSADPEFFLAHADLVMIREYGESPMASAPRTGLAPFNELGERFRCMDKLSIAQIEGRTRGGGSEFVLGLDMRFAALGKTVLSQPEAALGLMPGGGATQRLPPLIGRARALEVMLGCDDLSAEDAERWGYINRALPADQLQDFVRTLAYRVASYPAGVIAAIKQAVDLDNRVADGLLAEERLFASLVRAPQTLSNLTRALGRGVQQREAELGDFLKLCEPQP
ncbi:MAG: paaG6 [Hydrocarboniphaga sp.]|uniref:enoyl-CoA hydratase/isomerase family protein n=1 Tax=Hydrocarboniphaga sp. TaxID=2033016 RepID=UPI00262D3102|nr:enoyl-CoA hydratase/isomerase family protein [Hydrocarboniphaga sp.]MDB5969950.1 paaG6 [Hydrocarboniphaga sp.]